MIVTNTARAALGALIAALAWVGTARAAEPSIHIVGAWARATPPGVENGAVYCEIRNHGPADKLVGARTSAARGAEIHASVAENGVVEMRRIEALAVGAGASVELEPGGTHVMLVGLSAPLVPGTNVALTLVFEGAGEIAVEVPVVDGRSAPAAHEHERHAQ